jgi:hypothetical protein
MKLKKTARLNAILEKSIEETRQLLTMLETAANETPNERESHLYINHLENIELKCRMVATRLKYIHFQALEPADQTPKKRTRLNFGQPNNRQP